MRSKAKGKARESGRNDPNIPQEVKDRAKKYKRGARSEALKRVTVRLDTADIATLEEFRAQLSANLDGVPVDTSDALRVLIHRLRTGQSLEEKPTTPAPAREPARSWWG